MHPSRVRNYVDRLTFGVVGAALEQFRNPTVQIQGKSNTSPLRQQLVLYPGGRDYVFQGGDTFLSRCGATEVESAGDNKAGHYNSYLSMPIL
jgi:hypothetical protein